MAKPTGGLTAWFGKGPKGDWVDIGAPKKKASINPVVESLLKNLKGHTLNAFLEAKQHQ